MASIVFDLLLNFSQNGENYSKFIDKMNSELNI